MSQIIPNTWETFCRKKVGYHHESGCGADNACPHCGLANPTPLPTEDEVVVIPRPPSPTATGRQKPFSTLNADAANQARQLAITKGLRDTQVRAHAGSPAHSQRSAVAPSGKGKSLAKKFFRVVVTLHVGYLADECFGKYSDWETIRMSSLPKERYLEYRLLIMIISL